MLSYSIFYVHNVTSHTPYKFSYLMCNTLQVGTVSVGASNLLSFSCASRNYLYTLLYSNSWRVKPHMIPMTSEACLAIARDTSCCPLGAMDKRGPCKVRILYINTTHGRNVECTIIKVSIYALHIHTHTHTYTDTHTHTRAHAHAHTGGCGQPKYSHLQSPLCVSNSKQALSPTIGWHTSV